MRNCARERGPILRGPAFLARWLTAFRSNKYLWLWVPAFAGTTHSMREFVDSIFNSGILCRHDSAISRRSSPEVVQKRSPKNSEGAGNARRSMHPQPRVRMKKAHEHSHHGHTGINPAFPAQWFYGLFRALPGDEFLLSPSPAD